MNKVINEWIDKAEADYRTAEREFTVQDGFNYDAVCFHTQQCIEKLIKALLIMHNTNPPRTHDLIVLYQLLPPACKEELLETKDLRFLSGAAIVFRYPGESADKDDAEKSLQICRVLRQKLHTLLDYSKN
jgi:HEPN domain-containing protein